ncbi:MAG: hypothetical protein ORN49_13575 [Rhodobacteraceae bacterium]|nr:hypothetical protein [Paracoccaceae bacterium]
MMHIFRAGIFGFIFLLGQWLWSWVEGGGRSITSFLPETLIATVLYALIMAFFDKLAGTGGKARTNRAAENDQEVKK